MSHVFSLSFQFEQNPGLRKYLLKTQDNYLVDCDVMDLFLGSGLNAQNLDSNYPDRYPGKNMHGRVLMNLRAKFRADPKYAEEAQAIDSLNKQ